jgi:hypothetical protein
MLLMMVLLAAVTLVAVGIIFWRLVSRIDFLGLGDMSLEIPEEPWEEQFAPAGHENLPYAIVLLGNAYRWQNNSHLHRGAEFYRMFEDGPWKWAAQGRFAGKDLNCGHFFGLSVEAATEEAAHYGIDESQSTLLRLEFESVRVMDLTRPDFIKQLVTENIGNHQRISHSYYSMVSELIERVTGGNGVTDYLGYRAHRLGYQGILFYSARAMEELQIWRHDRELEYFTYGSTFWGLRNDPRYLNVVFFSGAELLSGTKAIAIGSAEQEPNPFHRQDPAELARLFDFGEDYQEEMAHVILSRPFYKTE